MQYIDYLNQFHRWRENHNPGDKVIVLYLNMLDMFSRRYWPEWAGVTTRQLMVLANTSNRNAAFSARDALVNAGLLEYRPGWKGTATVYKLLTFSIESDTENSAESSGNGIECDTENRTENALCGIESDTANSTPTKTKTNKTKTPPNPQRGTAAGDVETDFNRFWAEYPRKQGKGAARKVFDKARKKVTLETMLAAVERQRRSEQWNRDGGQYIPMPATWLNQERWSDEETFNPPPSEMRGWY